MNIDDEELFDFAHELWAMAQLLPHESIVDGASRIYERLKEAKFTSDNRHYAVVRNSSVDESKC